jgi:hypothetical protein
VSLGLSPTILIYYLCVFHRDWKKLTFYYFADSYINFNPLVTDLFKVYKTRIWMSAMNPASFAHPSAGLHPPGPNGPPTQGLGSIGEPTNDPMHSQYGAGGQNYPSAPLTGGNMLGNASRAPAQVIRPQRSLGFPPGHLVPSSEFNNLMQQNGFNPSYANGLPSISPQSTAFGNNEGPSGEVWMGLQGLSLNSH